MTPWDRLIVASLPLVPQAVIRRVSSRYVAGETLEETRATVHALNGEGCNATLDVLGEDAGRKEESAGHRVGPRPGRDRSVAARRLR